MHPRLQRIVTGSHFAGLEIQFSGEEMELHLVLLKRKGQQVVIEKSIGKVESIEKLPEHLGKDVPLAIAFTGKGILHRRISVDPAADDGMLLSKALPNAALKEFYLQAVPAAQDELFISVLRRATVDPILDQLKQFSVVACSFGPLSIVSILPLLGESKTELHFGRHQLRLQDDLPEEVHYVELVSNENSFLIGGQNVRGEMLLAFSTAFNQVLSAGQKSKVEIEFLNSAREDFLQRKLFRFGGIVLLAVLFIVLLGNYFIFSRCWSDKTELESRLQSSGGALTDLRKLEKQVQLKRAFLEQAGLLGLSGNSYYADQIVAALPREICFTRMAFAPRLKLSEKDSIGFKAGRIEIDGSCSQSVVLNRWLQELKTNKWVKSATLESYMQDKTMKQGEFEIALELK